MFVVCPQSCFLESVDKATLCCPLCRKRVSTWARLNSKKNTLVDQQLWNQIQTCFPLQCQRRLSGQDGDDDDHPVSGVPRVSRPGEVRQEYEDQVTKLMEERRAQDEEEKRASEELIQRLLAEEEELLQEERRRKEEDEQLARQLSNQLNSQEVRRVSNVTPAKKKEITVGNIDRFLCPRAAQPVSVSNKENILLLKAELQVDRPHPQTERSQLKRKSSELDTAEEQDSSTKRALLSSPSCPLEAGPVTDWEAELQVRQQQEEEDRRLALLLQKELDQEERQRATDRSKGSSDAYLLRHHRGGAEGTGLSNTPGRGSRKSAAKTAPSSSCSSPHSASSLRALKSSSSSSSRGVKQTTLTEIFSPPRCSSSSSSSSSSAAQTNCQE
ncbi:E3 ubiquitin-protein ligase rnf168 [Kryptolebias marmoratus]|uniref:E3 ubiquitin-protein ligase rnf168 n=1 Tax=Kryptolebias marmoratus TaxID=37003 RepID=UPI0018ACBEF0|nr:E3 ubiquitin-protein ligase rnf168 [Kryptolebias marmoratus]